MTLDDFDEIRPDPDPPPPRPMARRVPGLVSFMTVEAFLADPYEATLGHLDHDVINRWKRTLDI